MKLIMLRCAALISVAVVSGETRAQSCSATGSSEEQAVLAADQAWSRANAQADVAALDGLFDDRIVVIGGNGDLRDKAGEIAEVRPNPALRVHFFRTAQVCARIYGQMAVVVGLATWRITYNQRDIDHRRRYTSVFALTNGTWRMVNLQVSGPMPAA